MKIKLSAIDFEHAHRQHLNQTPTPHKNVEDDVDKRDRAKLPNIWAARNTPSDSPGSGGCPAIGWFQLWRSRVGGGSYRVSLGL